MSRETIQQLASQELANIDTILQLGAAYSKESGQVAAFDVGESRYGSYIDAVATFFNGFKGENYRPEKLDLSRLHEQSNVHYSKVRFAEIPVPAGFSGRYSDFLSLILKFVKGFEQLEHNLDKGIVFTAKAINDRDIVKSVYQPAELKAITPPFDQRDIQSMKSYFLNKRIAFSRAGQVYRSSSEIAAVAEAAAEVNNRLARIDIAAINKKTARLAELGKLLNERISDPEERVVTSHFVKYYTDYVSSMAAGLELLGMTVHAMTELTHCLNQQQITA